MLLIRLFVLIVILATVSPAFAQAVDVWVGTNGDHGIYHFDLDIENGKMSAPRQVSDIHGAGFVLLNEAKDKLYATSKKSGRGFVTSFQITGDHSNERKLKLLNQQPLPDGHPCHINFDRNFSVLFSAQYGAGSIACFPIQPDGTIGENSQHIKHQGGSKAHGNRQDTPHPHWIGADVTNNLVAVPDLGLDEVVVYRFDESTKKLQAAKNWQVKPGDGPRHMKFHSNGKFAYVLNEFSLTVSVFNRNESDQSFSLIQDIASLPNDLQDKRLNAAAEIRIHPNGRYVYTSNRGHDSISVFSVDQANGKLTLVEREAIRGSWPRNFNIDSTGSWLLAAGAHSNTIALFAINADGSLEFTRSIINVPSPICVAVGN